MVHFGRTFYQMPEDEQEFLAFLRTSGDLWGVSYWAVESRAALAPKPLVQYITEDDPEYVLFGLARHVQLAFDEGSQYAEKDECGPNHDQVIGHWSIPCHESYGLADYRRGQFRDNTLASSWLGVGNGRVLPKLKDDESALEAWAAALCEWLTANTPELVTHEGHNYPATRRAKQAVDKGHYE